MNILYYFWNEITGKDMIQTLRNMNFQVTVTQKTLTDYVDESQCLDIFDPFLQQEDMDCIFSFNFFPAIAKFCHTKRIPYLCWVYDCPHLTLYSKTVCFPEVYLHIFDKNLCRIPLRLGARHVYHTPLAVFKERLQQMVDSVSSYNYDVSFVGSLYQNNQFDQIGYLPEYISGYLSGLMTAQRKIWGYDLVGDALSDTIVSEMNRYVSLEQSQEFDFTPRDIFRNMILQKITSMDRIQILSEISKRFSLTLFSNPDESGLDRVKNSGYVSYDEEMPLIFHSSKINLNLSLRSITSGIPLRAMDIMGAGGFLLTSYQPELAEFFTPDEDFVFFENEADLFAKIEYYLSHDREREKIAQSGCDKVLNRHDYSSAAAHIFSCIDKH